MRRFAEAKMSSSTRVAGFAVLSVVMMAGLVWVAADQVWAAQGRTVKVTVNYEGSGEVNATSAIYVAAWDTPNIQGGAAVPIGGQAVVENGGVASLENLSASTVYVTALYVPGGWDQASAPPSGTSIGIYNPDAGFAPGAIEVGEGQTVEVEFSFDDTILMP
jgi:hypothetical protein